VDLDVFVAIHSDAWKRLDALSRRRRLGSTEVDEFVALYQRAGAQLAVLRARDPDAALTARLSATVARARTVLTGAPVPGWSGVARFVVVSFPTTLYRSGRWIIGSAAASLAVALVIGVWVAHSRTVLTTIGTPVELRQLADHGFRDYYADGGAAAFGAQVWTNNAWIAARCLVFGVFVVPVLLVLASNALNIGVDAGVLAAFGHLGEFFTLVLPHGLLELTAVFGAAGAGLRLGWSWIDPGSRTRAQSLAVTGRATVRAALGLTVALLVSGALEAFVTPSHLPAGVKIAIGAVVWAAFMTYVVVLGRRGVRAGDEGDLSADQVGDALPTAG
jgi:uncharacterized membrane protein SpoIIM required for sporulation